MEYLANAGHSSASDQIASASLIERWYTTKSFNSIVLAAFFVELLKVETDKLRKSNVTDF